MSIAAIAGLEVGRASHDWTARSRALARRHRRRAGRRAAVRRCVVAAAAAGVAKPAPTTVGRRRRRRPPRPFRVEFYEPRPSWATTFVRRALEADARFEVASLSFTSRGVSAQTGDAVAARRSAPRRLRRRRSSAASIACRRPTPARSIASCASAAARSSLVPDQRIDAGPARDLIRGAVDRSRRAAARAAGEADGDAAAPRRSQASELLVLRSRCRRRPTSIARVPGSDGSPVIVSMPRGDGRLLLSGAMDAWRFRAADNGAFDRFWQSTIAGLALAVPPPIDDQRRSAAAAPGERGEVIVRVRSRDVRAVSASIDGDSRSVCCPDAEAGVYRGRVRRARPTPGRSTIEVRAAAASQPRIRVAHAARAGRTSSAVAPTPRRRSRCWPSSHRGIDVTPDHLADLERFLRGAVDAASRRRAFVTRCDRRGGSLPFALCLSAEWWLRRRRGLR